MSANIRIRFGLQIVLLCLYSTPSHYHHCGNLCEGIELIKCLSHWLYPYTEWSLVSCRQHGYVITPVKASVVVKYIQSNTNRIVLIQSITNTNILFFLIKIQIHWNKYNLYAQWNTHIGNQIFFLIKYKVFIFNSGKIKYKCGSTKFTLEIKFKFFFLTNTKNLCQIGGNNGIYIFEICCVCWCLTHWPLVNAANPVKNYFPKEVYLMIILWN